MTYYKNLAISSSNEANIPLSYFDMTLSKEFDNSFVLDERK